LSSFSTIGVGRQVTASVLEREPAHASAADAHAAPVDEEADRTKSMASSQEPLLATVITNLANLRHEMLKAVAQNLRA
jgi:hypothetical protein